MTQNISTQTSPVSDKSRNIKAFGIVAVALAAWLVFYNCIQPLADWLAYTLLGLSQESHLGQSLAFFFYDVPKIILLLGAMIFFITLLRSFFSAEQTRAWLGGKRGAPAMCWQPHWGSSPPSAPARQFHSSSALWNQASRLV